MRQNTDYAVLQQQCHFSCPRQSRALLFASHRSKKAPSSNCYNTLHLCLNIRPSTQTNTHANTLELPSIQTNQKRLPKSRASKHYSKPCSHTYSTETSRDSTNTSTTPNCKHHKLLSDSAVSCRQTSNGCQMLLTNQARSFHTPRTPLIHQPRN